MIELLAFLWLFNALQPPKSELAAQTPQAAFAATTDGNAGFTIKLTADLKRFADAKTLLEIPNVLDLRLRQHDPHDRSRQNYPAFKMPDGSTPVLEAKLTLHSSEHPEWKDMTIGIPLAMLTNPEGEHEIVLNFTGVRWTIYVDGALLDNDFPFGYPQWAKTNTWRIDPEFVKNAAIYFPAITPEKKPAATQRTAAVQYWTPFGHNSWVGDVATFFHQGRYHVFYLYDRRHHGSKFCCGAHYFEHLSTKDFKTWTEHEAATPLEEQWECIGTGTPFVFNGSLCIGYGLHTTRVYPKGKTMLPAQWEYLEKHGQTGAFKRGIAEGVPAGATYAVSADGASNFKKSWSMFHPCENPSVFTDSNGKLRMFANYGANGTWESDRLDGGWRDINPGFPPGGDCTFFFRCGKYDYIIGGFTGLWRKPADAPNAAYEDMVCRGLDFYDGLNVPAITETAGGRFVMAGWIPIRGWWGGPLVFRELIQRPDGQIGSKWMNELMPQTEALRTVAANIVEPAIFPAKCKSFLLTFNVQPAEAGRGRFGVSFLPESGEQNACEVQVRLDETRAQFAPGSLRAFAVQEKSLREGGSPQSVYNYAIEKLLGVEKPFMVRVIVKNDEKIGGSLIDVEIAGQRTMISYRPDLTVEQMAFRVEDVQLSNVQLLPLKN